MKKTVLCALCAVMLLCSLCVPAFAAEGGATVYVTIANGELGMVYEAVEVTDVDGDGALTINDALYLAHEDAFEGGAAAGYASAVGDYGLAITKLWGVESGAGYGYYVNNASAFSLADPVANGDRIVAFVYIDTIAYSDTYCFFDRTTVSAASGESVDLTLSAAGYDENWNPITVPVVGAVITFDGEDTEYVTDSEGRVSVSFSDKKDIVISAKSDSMTLVPPVCLAEVDGPDSESNNGWVIWVVVAAVVVVAIIAVIALRAKKK